MTPNSADKTVWTGYNLLILRGMNSECVDRIYLAQPFNKNKDFHATPNSPTANSNTKTHM